MSSDPYARRVHRVMDYVRSNLAGDLSLEGLVASLLLLAALAGMQDNVSCRSCQSPRRQRLLQF